MTVFLIETYVIKPEKQAEFTAYKKSGRNSSHIEKGTYSGSKK
jgi:hypothetical protein